MIGISYQSFVNKSTLLLGGHILFSKVVVWISCFVGAEGKEAISDDKVVKSFMPCGNGFFFFIADGDMYSPAKHVAFLLYELSRDGPMIRIIQGNSVDRNALMQIGNGMFQHVRNHENILEMLMRSFPVLHKVIEK